jgi:hypothetical protein
MTSRDVQTIRHLGPACQPAFQFGTVTGTFSRKLPVYSIEFATLEIEKKSAREDLMISRALLFRLPLFC